MANTFGQQKDESAWQNNKELNPQVNSSVTDDTIEDSDNQGTGWRATDEKVESPTSENFDDAEAQKRNENIETDTPGLSPEVGK